MYSEQRVTNLNDLGVADDGTGSGYTRSVAKAGHKCHVLFDNLEEHLCDNIRRADAVVGCVAWMTSFPILYALQDTTASIIVQKEDFLRPDTGVESLHGWKVKLRTAYDRVKSLGERHDLTGTIISDMSICIDPDIQGVRCVGNHNTDKKPAFPRMHHKFLVFCKNGPGHRAAVGPALIPYAVWTGSFNFTHNATRSFENAVYLTDPEIVRAFFHEWEYVAALSEPLNWDSVWASPEWRIGT